MGSSNTKTLLLTFFQAIVIDYNFETEPEPRSIRITSKMNAEGTYMEVGSNSQVALNPGEPHGTLAAPGLAWPQNAARDSFGLLPA